jgi:hypothetical protein
MATTGLIPFATTYAVFASLRALDMVRNSIHYPRLNVKIAASHSGITPGPDGVTHQGQEDLSIMRSIANSTVIAPADADTTALAVEAAIVYDGPVYLSFTRDPVPKIFTPDYPFEIGKAVTVRDGSDATIFAIRDLTAHALVAAEKLAGRGVDVRVIDCHTLKPLDVKSVREGYLRRIRPVSGSARQVRPVSQAHRGGRGRSFETQEELRAPFSNNVIFRAPMYPVRLRSESSAYPDIPAFSHLAGRASQRPKIRPYFFVNTNWCNFQHDISVGFGKLEHSPEREARGEVNGVRKMAGGQSRRPSTGHRDQGASRAALAGYFIPGGLPGRDLHVGRGSFYCRHQGSLRNTVRWRHRAAHGTVGG